MMESNRKFWERSMRDLQWTAVIITLLALLWWLLSDSRDAGATAAPQAAPAATQPVSGGVWLQRGSSGDQVRAVQAYLAANGWSLDVDGHYGPVTERTVTRLQAMSGLTADGIVGPVTWDAFGLSAGATPAEEAVAAGGRADAPPAATAVAGRCTQYEDLLREFSPGWDVERMSGIMWRESRCQPDAVSPTGCCLGLLQIHELHIRNLAGCGVERRADLHDVRANICAAAVVYTRAGGVSPWSAA